MARDRKKTGGTDRREFLTGAGAAVALGAVAGFTGNIGARELQQAVKPISGRIEHNPSLCAGCGVCGLMCSLYHEREVNVVLSRAELTREPFDARFSLNVCRQCLSPSCRQSCPLKDSALCIDRETGVKYINAKECDGCGKCTQACPLKPARVKLYPDRKTAFKCDLCRDREEGPICVEYCGQHALTIVPGNTGV
jgi:Fe-S-cluster-containing hydrogenase component 2